MHGSCTFESSGGSIVMASAGAAIPTKTEPAKIAAKMSLRITPPSQVMTLW
ncbi:MAG: hypothetical protein HY680_00085 [Chloroflexi bacterium]|nr:hypothetical protein [Chloroflexota bacterium]